MSSVYYTDCIECIIFENSFWIFIQITFQNWPWEHQSVTNKRNEKQREGETVEMLLNISVCCYVFVVVCLIVHYVPDTAHAGYITTNKI